MIPKYMVMYIKCFHWIHMLIHYCTHYIVMTIKCVREKFFYKTQLKSWKLVCTTSPKKMNLKIVNK